MRISLEIEIEKWCYELKLGNENNPQLYKKDSPNDKNEIEIKQQMLKIIPQLKNLGNTGNRQ